MVNKLKLNENDIFKKSHCQDSIETEEGTVISSTNIDKNELYYLENPISSEIWKLINGENSIKKIAEQLVSRYDVSKDTVFSDIKEFFNSLYSNQLIIYAKK